MYTHNFKDVSDIVGRWRR